MSYGYDDKPRESRIQKLINRAIEDVVKKTKESDPAFEPDNLMTVDLINPQTVKYLRTMMGDKGAARALEVLNEKRLGYYNGLECGPGEKKIIDPVTRISRCVVDPDGPVMKSRIAALERMANEVDGESGHEKRVRETLYNRYKNVSARCERLNKVEPNSHDLVINYLYQTSCVQKGAFGDFNCDKTKNPRLTKLINLGGVQMCVDPEIYGSIANKISNVRRESNKITKKDMESMAEIIRMFNSMEDVYKSNVEDLLQILREERSVESIINYAEANSNPFTKKIAMKVQQNPSLIRLLPNAIMLGTKMAFPDFFSEKFGMTDDYYKAQFGTSVSELAKGIAASRGIDVKAMMSGAGEKNRNRTPKRIM